jgi:pimeloyl-ACP methyl ester carboxylesterase
VAADPTHCAYHRRRPKVTSCGTCGNPICADCIVRTGVGIKCRRCTGVKAAAPSKVEKVERETLRAQGDSVPTPVGAGRAPAGGGRKPWAIPVLAGGLVVLLVAGYGLISRDSGPSGTDPVESAGPAGPTERVTEFLGAGGQRIGGTLTIPPLDEGGIAPAVLIIPGLGAIDRNSVVAANPPDALRDALLSSIGPAGLTSPDPLYKDLSQALANAGVASFRYEKRGTKAIPLKDGQKLSFDDEVADARAALDMLGKRAEIGSAPLILLGHDTGGVVAMRLAAGNTRVKGVVAVSTPARPYGEVVAADLARARGAAIGDAFRGAVATLASTGAAPAADTLPEVLRPMFSTGQDAYLKSLFALDATAEVANVAVPVLQVRGGADPAITAADTAKLSSAVRVSGQVMVGGSQTDHNLTIPGPAHEHNNTAAAPVVQHDTDAISALSAWVKTQFAG